MACTYPSWPLILIFVPYNHSASTNIPLHACVPYIQFGAAKLWILAFFTAVYIIQVWVGLTGDRSVSVLLPSLSWSRTYSNAILMDRSLRCDCVYTKYCTTLCRCTCTFQKHCYTYTYIYIYRSFAKIRPPFLHRTSRNERGVGVYTRVTQFYSIIGPPRMQTIALGQLRLQTMYNHGANEESI